MWLNAVVPGALEGDLNSYFLNHSQQEVNRYCMWFEYMRPQTLSTLAFFRQQDDTISNKANSPKKTTPHELMVANYSQDTLVI